MTEAHVSNVGPTEVVKTADPGAITFAGATGSIPASIDSEAISLDITKRILDAETAEAMFDVFDSSSSNALIGKRFELTGATWGWYAADRGDIPLARVEATDLDTGEETVFPTTARNLTAFLFNCQTRNLLPVKVRITGDRTRSGQTALRFERP